jgi:hypothetical protein
MEEMYDLSLVIMNKIQDLIPNNSNFVVHDKWDHHDIAAYVSIFPMSHI